MKRKVWWVGLLLWGGSMLVGASEVEFKGIVLDQDRPTALAVASTMGKDWICTDSEEQKRVLYNIGRSYFAKRFFPWDYPQGYEADKPVVCAQRGGGIRIGQQAPLYARLFFVRGRLQYLEMELVSQDLPLAFEAMQARYGKPRQEQTRAGVRYQWKRGRDWILLFPASPEEYGSNPGVSLVGFLSQDAIDAQVARDKAVRAKELAKARSDW